ncbi:hypothetical protein FHS82_003482 [Pseudochelatococcus lubricantis]|uniref:DUF2948 family protein n=1 Tax=Pseudochelatococcus lubricantis TaxID=1538102 RepID=A0ABX0V545_9HYPH|nr:DUF2948 family protein [Pseudochelatococcus lubricantis]NIJ59624.1 hypothetical protein [Pseudochelatococcus lubricantis]
MDENDMAGEADGDRLLRLLALDENDLDVISAHLQDAHVRRADLHFLPHEHRFVLALQRFDWERPEDAPPRRRLAALHFDQVRAVRHRNLEHTAPDSLFNLLAIHFIEGEKPSGAVVLEFSGGAAIRLDVECIEAQMKDLGPMWEVAGRPAHTEGEGSGREHDGGSDAGKT